MLQIGSCKWYLRHILNPLTPRNDQHLISLPMVSIQYPANKYENTQTYQVEVVILI